MQLDIVDSFSILASVWQIPRSTLETYYNELQLRKDFLSDLNTSIRDVPEFSGVQFEHVRDLRLYRSLLYLFTRALKPDVFVETGVLNGFSSAFILLAMSENAKGTLFSVDLPPVDARIIAQGTNPLPKGKEPGWAIPFRLRSRHRLCLGLAQKQVPDILEEHGPVDVFLHDSDHSYQHMMFELTLAWHYLRPGGWLLCDNVEQNNAFADLSRGVGCEGFVAASFDSPERVWKHGLLQKPF